MFCLWNIAWVFEFENNTTCSTTSDLTIDFKHATNTLDRKANFDFGFVDESIESV